METTIGLTLRTQDVQVISNQKKPTITVRRAMKKTDEIGYEVFNTKQTVDDHERLQHEPADNFHLPNPLKRPTTSSAGISVKKSLPGLAEISDKPAEI